MRRRAAEFYADMMRRRTVRSFSDRPIPRDIIEDCLRAAGTAPSGANLQPWHFVVGYPATDTVVPDIHRKSLEEIVTFM
jgi:iodotyrosine deiodinase